MTGVPLEPETILCLSRFVTCWNLYSFCNRTSDGGLLKIHLCLCKAPRVIQEPGLHRLHTAIERIHAQQKQRLYTQRTMHCMHTGRQRAVCAIIWDKLNLATVAPSECSYSSSADGKWRCLCSRWKSPWSFSGQLLCAAVVMQLSLCHRERLTHYDKVDRLLRVSYYCLSVCLSLTLSVSFSPFSLPVVLPLSVFPAASTWFENWGGGDGSGFKNRGVVSPRSSTEWWRVLSQD